MIKLKVTKGNTSFADNHGTRYWSYKITNLKKNIWHEILHYDNDLLFNKKYHCYICFFGKVYQYDTDSFKDAVKWIRNKLNKYII